MKLIKVNTDHYILADDSEIKEGDYWCNIHSNSYYIDTKAPEASGRFAMNSNAIFINPKKITHSTQPLECDKMWTPVNGKQWMCNTMLCCGKILNPKTKPISLQEVKELIGEVDVAEISYLKKLESSNQDKNWIGYGKGIDGVSKEKWKRIYNQALEDNKEKKYTEEDVIEFAEWIVKESLSKNKEGWTLPKIFNRRGTTKELLQLWKEQQLKTIWDVEFDSQGKLKLKK